MEDIASIEAEKLVKYMLFLPAGPGGPVIPNLQPHGIQVSFLYLLIFM